MNRTRSGSMFMTVVALGLLMLGMATPAYAGGPAYVAGTSYFNPGLKGKPIGWLDGNIQYYTDQGDLSPILLGADADAFVADAFSHWTAVPTATLSATRAGQLAEDVSGSNVTRSGNVYNLPADVASNATGTPVGIVYDADGAVTDALLGKGASGDCFLNATLGGPDNFSSDAHIVHALVVLNGTCVQTPEQLPDLKYRLVRTLGRVLGLGWSQLNLNALTWDPLPVSDDFEGFPLMHFSDRSNCVPVTVCYGAHADQPKMDDRTALAMLYPGDTSTTAHLHGSVQFSDRTPMQGVNVVARWIDPATSLPSRKWAAASVSGLLFRGNSGNPVTGFANSKGQDYAKFGSDDPAWEGYFDLPALEFPGASNSAQFQLTVESIDVNWSYTVGPYAPWQVLPSGTFVPLLATVTRGGDLYQDLVMQNSAVAPASPAPGQGTTYDAPAALPTNAEWTSVLGNYAETHYFQFDAQAGRTLAVEVTALDETATPSFSKGRPVMGMWLLSIPQGTLPSARTSAPFLTSNPGMSQLNATIFQSGTFRLGVADQRGDGRPDYSYHARVLYADSVSPDRASLEGGQTFTVKGLGFHGGTTATIGGDAATVVSVSATQVVLTAPGAGLDGVQDITVTDPATGSSSNMTGALTYGAAASDGIAMLQGSQSAVPMGTVAPLPVKIQVTAADRITPVHGASVVWTADSGATLSACAGATSCTVLTDASGQSVTSVTVNALGTLNITATLAPASYQTAKSVQCSLQGVNSTLAIGLSSPNVYVARGATVDVPLLAQVVSGGSPLAGRSVNFLLTYGSASLSATNATTNSQGYVSSSVHVNEISGDVVVSACVAPDNKPCQSFALFAVVDTAQQVQLVSGGNQTVTLGHPFTPIVLRVVDSSPSLNAVMGAVVIFHSTLLMPDNDAGHEVIDESAVGRYAMPVLFGGSQTQVVSDGSGMASFTPSQGAIARPLENQIWATVGATVMQFEVESRWPSLKNGRPSGLAGSALPPVLNPLRPVRMRSATAPAYSAAPGRSLPGYIPR